MQLSTLFSLASFAACALGYDYVRLNRNDSALLVVDMQVGLYSIVRDVDPVQFKNNLMAHSEIAKVFNLPVVMTTSAEVGQNGPLPKEITDMHPNAPIIRRNGEVNAWDNAEFRAAVKATGKKQIILAGITTDVCTAFLALSLRAEGYEVFANADASGTFGEKAAIDANNRMRDAGVQILSNFATVCELMRDWRNFPGSVVMLDYFNRYFPSYGFVVKQHGDAINNGTIQPGEQAILP